MNIRNEDFDKLLDRLVASTRSPRGRFAADRSWKLLQNRMHGRRRLRILWQRAASAAAVVTVVCMASWAAYRYVYLPQNRPEAPAEVAAAPAPAPRATLVFDQQPLEEIARRLSATFHTTILIEGDSLRSYRMTGTFGPEESLTEILDLLKGAAGFSYTQRNDTITLTNKPN